MTEKRIEVIPDSYSIPMIHEGDSILLIPESDSISLVPENDSPVLIPENIEPKDGHLRRYSTGNVAIPYTRVKILSRYLESSTISCHDNCKFGMQQALETKMRSPMLKRTTEVKGKGRDMEKVVTLTETKKNLAVRYRPSGSGSLKFDIPVVTKREVSSSTKKQIILSKQHSLPPKRIHVSVSANSANGPKSKSLQSKPSSFPVKGRSRSKDDGEIQGKSERGTSPISSQGVLSSREETELGKSRVRFSTSIGGDIKASVRPSVSLSVKKVLKRPIATLFPKCSVKRDSSVNTEKFKKLKEVSDLNNEVDVGKAECEEPSSEDVPEKTLHVIESSTESKTVTFSQSGDRACGSSRSSLSSFEDKSFKCVQNEICTARLSSLSTKKTLRCTQNGNPATQLPQSSKNRSMRCNRYGTRVIQSSGPSLASVGSSKPIHSSCSSEGHEAEVKSKVVNKVESRTRPRKGQVISMNKNLLGRKVNIKVGMVVQRQPGSGSPRLLKVRRKVLNDCQIGKFDTDEINLKHTEVVDGETNQIGKIDTDEINLKHTEVVDGETNVAEGESAKVVFKNRGVQPKKIVRSLLNSMIEETANKLAKTRKSKVKALVGAFETVISLQDSKTKTFSTVSEC